MPASFRFAMIGRRSEADAELDAHRTRLLEARDPAIIGTRGARVSRAGLGEVELRILIEDVEHGDVQRAVERVGRQAESDAEIELGQPVALERGATADERAIGADRRIRSEESRVGKEGVSTCRSRWSPVK